ncbi:hypothetical protein [Salipiger sp.]
MSQAIVQSRNYIPKEQGWRVNLLTGEAEFNNVTVTPRPTSDDEPT